MSIGVAIIGAGIFARQEHLPAVQATTLLTLKAVYSRSKACADNLANRAAKPVKTYYDSPTTSNHSLEDLLARKDIDAVIIALPICVQPTVIKEAIEAGKHVLSEKPIAKDIETAAHLIRWYKHQRREEIWSVGENFRFFEPVVFAVEQIKRLGGELVTFSVDVLAFIDEDDEYYRTAWRQKPDYQGGFLLDGGIHFVAALRCLLEAAGQSVSTVRASTSLIKEDLAPVDTLNAHMTTSNKRNGTFNLSYGSEFRRDCQIRIVTTTGAVAVSPSEVRISTSDKSAAQEKSFRFPPGSGVRKEVAAFAESIYTNEPNPRGSPEQAYHDLKLLQGMLESGEEEGAAKRI
ncbi:MAG: hypothetical protein ALECFALPRED_010992 [Alectoria fallacina]|uniref:Uncharacterized protein n=1 Tax=Alectoria fallacina TaxID=1903189 RepID=A0A8H3JA97_9LECA|nr:MAG: hypothetical protein ALECFALPRED_010992 [Alectoria fallacina]